VVGADPAGFGSFGYAYLDLGSAAELRLTWAPVPESARALGLAAVVVLAAAAVRRGTVRRAGRA
jgi:hypothetical protein